MRTKHTKILPLLLAAMLLICLLAGCGQKPPPAETVAPTPEQTAAPTPEPTPEPPAEAEKPKPSYRVGGSVSGAYVDPNAVPSMDLKAQGYAYDRAALTYNLVWSDEFDYEGAPDPARWGYDTGGSGWGNNELQYYTPGDNALVGDGVLTITLKKEQVNDREYTSTRLVSRQKGDWLYGKVEVSARLPAGKGTWPAIWMLPTDWKYGDWPASGEIDIMEHVGYDQDNIVQSVHCGKYYGGNPRNHSVRVPGVSEDFHTYTLEWLPDQLIFSVDGEEQFTYDPNQYTANPTKDYWPFDQRFHLLINLAFGGDWGGARGVDDSYLPVTYEIDYVRVYQSPEINALTGQ